MSIKGWIIKHRSERARKMKQDHFAAWLVLETIADHAAIEWIKPLWLPPGAALITAELCGVSKDQFPTAIKYLESQGDIEVIHRGRKDKNSRLHEYTPPLPPIQSRITYESTDDSIRINSGINGTVAFIRSSDIYEVKLLDDTNQDTNQSRINPAKNPHIEEERRKEDKERNKEKEEVIEPNPLPYSPSFFEDWQSKAEKDFPHLQGKIGCTPLPNWVKLLQVPEIDMMTLFKDYELEKISKAFELLMQENESDKGRECTLCCVYPGILWIIETIQSLSQENHQLIEQSYPYRFVLSHIPGLTETQKKVVLQTYSEEQIRLAIEVTLKKKPDIPASYFLAVIRNPLQKETSEKKDFKEKLRKIGKQHSIPIEIHANHAVFPGGEKLSFDAAIEDLQKKADGILLATYGI